MPGDLGQPWETRRGGLGTGLSFETPSLKGRSSAANSVQ